MKRLPLLALAIALSGCEVTFSDANTQAEQNSSAPAQASATPAANPDLTFADVDGPADAPRPAMQIQVVLARLGFSPGVIDGREGQSLELALRGFQEANGLDVTGRLDPRTAQALQQWRDVPATRLVRIPAGFAAGPFVPDLPKETSEQARFPALGYRNLMEALAERFHTTPETLVALNAPRTPIGPERVIRVPNVADVDPGTLGADERGWNRTLLTLAVSPDQPQAERLTVDKSEGVLKAFDAEGKLIATFPATMGSSHDPLPLGAWKILGVSRNPDFHYNPKLFWDVSDNKEDALLKPGPNGPVGVVWIDLSKEHYGIHGTGEPQTIGRAESHGCIRLTNWDAARLAQMVKSGLVATFQS